MTENYLFESFFSLEQQIILDCNYAIMKRLLPREAENQLLFFTKKLMCMEIILRAPEREKVDLHEMFCAKMEFGLV